MKHIVKVNNILDAKDNPIRPIIALDNSGILFFNNGKAIPEGFVDFGLPSGTLWSTKNIGATNGDTAKSWYGNYYAWGEIKTKSDYSWLNYKYANGAAYALIKYCNNSNYGYMGFTDNLTQLVPEDDIATITNPTWRIPTKEDFRELPTGTVNNWVTNYNNIEGLNGRLYTKATITRPSFKNIPLYLSIIGIELNDEMWKWYSTRTLEEINAALGNDIREKIYKNAEMTIKADYGTDYGFAEKEIDPTISMFIPAAGYCSDSNINNTGSHCRLWTSNLDLYDPSYAYSFDCNSSDSGIDNLYYRNYGLSIRPIC